LNNLDVLMKDINKKYKDEIVTKGCTRTKMKRIPFTSPRLNYMTYGGIAIGKATELYGGEGSGKTTTALDLVKNAQFVAQQEYDDKVKELETLIINEKKEKKIKEYTEQLELLQPRKVVYVDAENTLDEDWAKLLGVDLVNLIILRPQEQTAEEITQMILDIIKTGDCILTVLDSIPCLVSQQIYDEDMDKKMYGGIASVMATFSSKVSGILYKYETALVMINQMRENLASPYGGTKTPGGKALKHLYALRLEFRKGVSLNAEGRDIKKSEPTPKGNIVDVLIEKTKICKPDRKIGYYTLMYDYGIDYILDTIDMALLLNTITTSGAWFYYGDEKFQGKSSLIEYFRNNKQLFEILENNLKEVLNNE